MAKLKAHVHVHGPDGSRAYGPDDDIPDDVAELITNPAAWEEPPAGVEKLPEGNTGPATPPAGAPKGEPRGNASRDEWAAYATSLGVPFEETASRDDIRTAVAARGPQPDGED